MPLCTCLSPLKAAKVAETSITSAVLIVGENNTRVSFGEWNIPDDVEDSSTIVVAVTSIGTLGSAAGQQAYRVGAGSEDEMTAQGLCKSHGGDMTSRPWLEWIVYSGHFIVGFDYEDDRMRCFAHHKSVRTGGTHNVERTIYLCAQAWEG